MISQPNHVNILKCFAQITSLSCTSALLLPSPKMEYCFMDRCVGKGLLQLFLFFPKLSGPQILLFYNQVKLILSLFHISTQFSFNLTYHIHLSTKSYCFFALPLCPPLLTTGNISAVVLKHYIVGLCNYNCSTIQIMEVICPLFMLLGSTFHPM